MRAYFFTSSWIIVEGVEGGVKGSEIRSRRGERPCSFSTRGTYFSAVNNEMGVNFGFIHASIINVMVLTVHPREVS